MLKSLTKILKQINHSKRIVAIAGACKGTGAFILAGTIIYCLLLPLGSQAGEVSRLLVSVFGAAGFAAFAGVYTVAMSSAGHSHETAGAHQHVNPLSRCARMLFSGLIAALIVFALGQLSRQPELANANLLFFDIGFFLSIGMILACAPKGEFFQPALSADIFTTEGQRLNALKKRAELQESDRQDLEGKDLSERLQASTPSVSFKKTNSADIQEVLKKVSEVAGESLDPDITGLDLYRALNS